MKKLIATYFGTTATFVGYLALLGIWLFLFGMEELTGHSNDGSSGYLLGVGLCWLVTKERPR